MDTLVTSNLSFTERLSSIRRLKCTSVIEKGLLLCSLLGVTIIRGSTVYTCILCPPYIITTET